MPYFYVYPFAEAVPGERAEIPTNNPGNGSVSYQNGFPINYQLVLGTDPSAIPIPRDQTNQLYYDLTDNLRQYQTQGVPQWISAAQNNPGGTPTPFAYDLYAQVRYDDGSGVKIYESLVQGNTDTPGVAVTSWLVISGNAQGDAPGTIIAFGGTTPPLGYVACDGLVFPTVGQYSRLYAAIGQTWPGGNGVDTFAVPDFRGCALIHRGGLVVPDRYGANGIGNTVGVKGGAASLVMHKNQLVPHNHAGSALPVGTGGGGSTPLFSGPIGTQIGSRAIDIAIDGGGEAINNIPPSGVVLFCIKY